MLVARGGGGHLREVWVGGVPKAFKPWPCVRQKLLILLPCLRQETLLSDPDLFCFVYRIIGIANVDRSSRVFTLFERLPFQKDTLFKALNNEIVYPVQDSRPWKPYPVSVAHPYRPNKGVPPPPTPLGVCCQPLNPTGSKRNGSMFQTPGVPYLHAS